MMDFVALRNAFGRATLALALLLMVNACAGGTQDGEAEAEVAADTTEAGAHGNAAEWSYTGATGPAQWASLAPAYEACRGALQSPVDITGAQPTDSLAALQLSYQAAPAHVDTSGYVLHIDAEAGALVFQGQPYDLVQFHFHTPSEHTLDGETSPAEAHFVHQNEAGALAVVGVMIEEGAENAALREALSPGTSEVNPTALLPGGRSYFTYSGSLTTPPCTEGVRWIVMGEPVELSSAQIQRLQRRVAESNRPVQPLGERTVLSHQ